MEGRGFTLLAGQLFQHLPLTARWQGEAAIFDVVARTRSIMQLIFTLFYSACY